MKKLYILSKTALFSKTFFTILILVFFSFSIKINAQTQTRIAGTGISSGGGAVWNNPGNITANDNTNSTTNLGGTGSSRDLTSGNFNFSIPTGSIINGIEANIKRYSSSSAGGNSIDDRVVRLLKNGTLVGNNLATNNDWPTNYAVANYGGTTNLWGTTWTVADINNANFGLLLEVINESNFNRTGYVDYIEITIYYSIPVSIISFTPNNACINSGTAIVITGTNFSTTSNVTINGVSASYIINSNSQITATLPNGATTGLITVFTGLGNATSASNFTVNSLPTVASIVGNSSLCQNTNITLTNATSGGVWSSNNTSVATINTSGIVTGISNGTSLITYTVTNGNGCSNSVSRSITVTASPIITSSSLVCLGNTTQLSPSSGGNWLSNNPTIASIDNSGLVAGNAIGSTTFTFTETATGCAATSNPVSVVSAPQIILQPITTQTFCTGNLVQISTTASGNGLTFQWYKGATILVDAGNISGSNSSILQLNPISISDAGNDYYCSISGTCLPSIDTNTSEIIVFEAITITTQPDVFQLLCANDTATLSVSATGTSLTYKWYKGATALVDDARISGSTSSSLTISSLTLSDNGSNYYCIVSGASPCANVVSSNAQLSINESPNFTTQPVVSQTVCQGDSISFSITATGGGLSYQWQKGGISLSDGGFISGSTTNTLTISTTTLGDSASDYTCIITNACGSTTSDLSALTVNETVAITTQPDVFQLLCTNDTATLSVLATGTSLTYQWYNGATALLDDARISGSSTATLTITSLVLTDISSNYYCIVSGASPCANVTSNNAQLSINESPNFTTQPAVSQSICQGDPVSFSVVATGGSLNYQWQKGGTPLSDGGTISGSITATLTISATSLSDSASDYTCVITNACGSTTSDLSALSVNQRPFIFDENINVCSENSFSFTPINAVPTLATIVPSNTTYSWLAPVVTGGLTGGSAQSGQLSVSQTLTNPTDSVQTATYTVTPTSGTSGFCVGATFTVIVTVNPKPSIINSSFSVCSGEAFTVIPTNGGGNIIPSGTTFSWGIPSVSGGISGGTAGSGVTSLAQILTNSSNTIQTATYNVTATSGTCVGSTFTIQINVRPKPNVAASSISQSICSGESISTLTFSNPNSIAGAIDYNWTRDNSTIVTGMPASGSGNINSVVLYNATNNIENTTFTVTATSEGLCISDPITIVIMVKPIPSVNVTPASQTICSEENIGSIAISNPNNIVGTTYNWTRSNTTNSTGIANSGTVNLITGSLTNNTNIQQTTTFAITAVADACNSALTTATVIINPKPTVNALPISQTICGNSSISAINITNPNTIFGTTFSWTRNNTTNVSGIANSGTSSSISGTLINSTNSNQTVQFTISATANGCLSTSAVVEVIVKPTPQVVATPNTQTKCNAVALTTINLTNPNNIAGTTYSWTRNNTSNLTGIASSGSGNSISGTLTNSTTSTQTTTFTIIATSANGCSSTTTATATIYAPLTAPVISTAQTVCLFSNPTALYTSTPANGGSGTYTYQWQSSLDNIAYNNISGATGSTYQPPTVNFGTNNTYYKLITTNICGVVMSNIIFVEVVSDGGFSFNVDDDLNGAICPGNTFSPSLTSVHLRSSAVRFRWNSDPTYISPGTGGPVGTTGAPFWFFRTSSADIGPLTVQNNTNATVTTQLTITPDVYNFPGPPSGSFICSTSSEVINVTIRPKPVATATIPNSTICNNSASNINITGNIIDANMTFAWTRNNTTNVSGTNSGNSGNVAPGVSFTITNNLTNNTTSTQNVTYTITPSSNGCSGAAITIIVSVAPPSTPGVVATNQTVCYGGNPAAFTVTTAATGLNLTYQWQKSSDNVTYNNIIGATSSTYDEPGPVNQTTWYRRIVFSTVNGTVCSSINTTPIIVTVNTINPGSIATDQTICSGGNPAAFTSVVATGAGTITYQWQSNTTSCSGSWNNISGAISAIYDVPTGLLVTTYYRRIAYSTLNSVICSEISNCIVVYINNVTPGSIGTDQTLCGNNPDAFTETLPSSASGTITYQWYKNTTGCSGSWTAISGATSSTYDAPAGLLVTTYYQRTTISTLNGVSCSAISNCITVTVNSVTAGVISGNRTVCYGGDPSAFTQITAGSGTGLSYQWQNSTDNIFYTNISGATSSTYDEPGPIYQTTYFRRVTTGTVNATGCSANSNFITVFVNNITASVIAGSQNVCASSETPTAFTIVTPAVATGSLYYQWQRSTTGCSGPWTTISGATSSTYSPIAISQTTYYQLRVTSRLNGVDCIDYSNCIEISFNGKTWNGSVNTDWNTANNWTPNGVPNAMNCVIIPNVANDPIISGTNFEAFAYSLSILNNGKLTINTSNNLTVTDFVSVHIDADFNIENNASLVQINDSAINTGNIQYTRTSRAITRWAYIYWGSPVNGNVYSQIPTQFDLKYRWQPGTLNGTWLPLSSTTNGEGFISRVKNIAPFSTGTGTIDFNFEGIPNNGVINVNVDSYDSSSMVSGNTALFANPYPSTIDGKRFLEHSNNSELGGTLFFWTSATLYSGTGLYNVQDYASWNLTGGTGTAPATDPSNLSLKPNGKIASGQGFFSQIWADGQITFDNSLRESNGNSQFFRTQNTDEKHRFWLNLYNNTKFRQTLIGYVSGATNGVDRLYDGDAITSNEINIYSIIQNQQLVIQGRNLPFDDNDIVPIGYKTSAAGYYTIAIDENDGLFAGSQAIYLKDLSLGIEHDLKQSPYVFQTTAGTFNNRFEIVYKTNTLSIDEQNSSSAYAFIYNNQLQVNATIDIKEITLFDIAGKQIIKYDIKDTSTHFENAFNHANGVYIAKVKLIDDTLATFKLAH